MSFLPSVERGKFKLKKTFQSGKILACIKKSEICPTSTLKLIKMMKMPGSVSLFHMHALLQCDSAILTYILHFFALCRGLKRGGGHGTMPPS